MIIAYEELYLGGATWVAPKLGTGWRRLLVLSIGPKWVVLFSPFSLQRERIRRRVYEETMHRPVVAPDMPGLAARIEAKAKTYARIGVAYPEETVKTVLEALRDHARSTS